MIEKNTAFLNIIENWKNSSYLLNGTEESIIYVVSQGSNIKPELIPSINNFEMEAIVLRFWLQAKNKPAWK